jgi:acetyl-CoA carboxylase biotin carboxyl carrier protein
MRLTDADIAQILALLKDNEFDELELEWDDIYLRIARRSQSQTKSTAATQLPPSFSRAPDTDSPAVTHHAGEPQALSRQESVPEGIVEVRSAIMGTVYRAQQPGDPPFVEIGSVVAAGDTLCLLEVMKVFTAVKAQQAGVIEKILVSDGALVDYNQVIFWIQTAQSVTEARST